MTITLRELLVLVGRLDSSPALDSPRERFRRFLSEHLTNVHDIRELIEQTQHSLGEQSHYALQDLVTLLGRFLGFETAFGTYQPLAGALKYDGHWNSRGRLHVVLEMRTDQTPDRNLDSLSRSLEAMTATSHLSSVARPIGLCVVMPSYALRSTLEEALRTGRPGPAILIASVRTLLSLAEFVATERLKHEDVLRLLGSGSELDFIIELLERLTASASSSSADAPPASLVSTASKGSRFWVATISDDEGAPEEFVEVVEKRKIFGIPERVNLERAPNPGDWICFAIPRKGVIGWAEIASIADSGPALMREWRRFSQVLHLRNVEIRLATPIVPDFETQVRLNLIPVNAATAASPLVRITSRDFISLTHPPHESKAEGHTPASSRPRLVERD